MHRLSRTRASVTHRAGLRLAPLALVALVGVLLLGSTRTAFADGGEVVRYVYDGEIDPRSIPLGQSISLISDCTEGMSPPNCGAPPARWAASNRPVQVCSIQTSRPAWLSAEAFRAAVAAAAVEWNRAEVPLGVRYTGDCALGSTLLNGDGRNEIGFQDRLVVSGGEAGVTDSLTTWTPPTNPQVRTITESDILMPSGFPDSPACFQHALVHEMGHLVGLGHSTDSADLMYPTITLSNPAGCRATPTPAELARLQDVYGVNRGPTVDLAPTVSSRPGEAVTLAARALDPEQDPLTFSWRQLSGEPVQLAGAGTDVASFTPPVAGDFEFAVTVTDRYLHETSARVLVMVAEGSGGTSAGIGLVPPRGFGLFVFGGGPEQALLAASGCPAETAAFWVSDGQGDFVVWVPGTSISAVNAAWHSLFPEGLPANLPVLGRCQP